MNKRSSQNVAILLRVNPSNSVREVTTKNTFDLIIKRGHHIPTDKYVVGAYLPTCITTRI